MDFYFTERSHSARFVDFLEGVVPTKVCDVRTCIVTQTIWSMEIPSWIG